MRQQQKYKHNQLPQELITEILLCSSVKSILRFKCVSKSFCTFIDSSEFTHLHRNTSAENKKNRKLIIRGHATEKLHVFDVDSGLEERVNKPYRKTPKPYGYCNGLVLLFVDSFKLALWNPSTKQYRNLPPCPVKVPTGSHSTALGMGLGYDSTRDDYKVVLIEDVKAKDHDLQVWIFRLRSYSWERIQDFPYRSGVPFVCFGYFVNGSLHWLYKPHGIHRVRTTIFAFDVAKETISKVSQPDDHIAKRPWYPTNLHTLDGRLCVSYFCYNKPNEAILYVRDKDGTNFKWRELFHITPEMPLLIDRSRFKNFRVLGYSKEGDDNNKIMLDLGFKFLVLYDLKEKSFTTTKNIKLVDDDARKLCNNYQFLCLESLVSLGGDFEKQRRSGQKRKKRGA